MTEPYGVGTVSVANGGTVVTGTSTFWVGKVRKNDLFTVPAQGLFARVTADPTENDELAINGWPGTDLVDAEYEIISTYIAVDTASRTRELLLGLSLIDPNYDAQVADLAGRAAYDDKPGPTPTERGFAVLVSDIGDGRSAIYSKDSNASADWSDAAYFSGPTGAVGWSPQLVAESDGERRVLKLAGYIGGEGTEPTDNVGEYLKADGTFTATIGDAVDIRGEGFVFRGAYSGATAYAENDVVRDAGSSWIALQATTGNAPPTLPTTSNAYWELLAQKGNDGAGTIVSLVEGNGISIDNTDPANPVISADAQEITIVAGPGINVDTTDPTEPVISSTIYLPPQGRLTLASGIAVMKSSTLGATTIYYTPSNGNMIPVNDGTKFVPRVFTELSQATTDTTKSPAACAANSNYDLFVWDDGGTIRCTRGPAFASNVSRGTGAGTTELDFTTAFPTNKFAITNGPAANRGTYVGTIRTNASSQVDYGIGGSANGGVAASLGVWNMYNRDLAIAASVDTTSYTYSAAVLRQAHASAGNQVSVLVGLPVDALNVNFQTRISTTATATASTVIAIGEDSTTVAASAGVTVQTPAAAIFVASPIALLSKVPLLGFHTYTALEAGNGSAANTVNSASNATLSMQVWN